MRIRVFSALLGAGLVGLALPMSSASAGTVLVFGQDGTSSQFTATNNGTTGAAGGTSLSAIDLAVNITGIDNSSPLPGGFPAAFLNLSANSTSNAAVDGAGHITEDFSGTFSITENKGGKGVNYLSGVFANTVFGIGTGMTLTGSGPVGVPSFTSDVITSLAQTRALSFSFTNVTPAALVTGDMTLGGFQSNVSGSFSAGVPEPASIALLGIGLTALLVFRRRLKKTITA
jgi:hypothetical protein